MSEELKKQLEREAREIQKSTIIEEEKDEEVIEDIEFEIVPNEVVLYDVYNNKGQIIQVDEAERKAKYVECADGTWVTASYTVTYNNKKYNHFIVTPKRVSDKWGYHYLPDYPDTYDYYIGFDKNGNVDVNKKEKASKTILNSNGYFQKVLIDDIQYLVAINEIRDNFYEVGEDRILRKRKSPEDFKLDLFKVFPYFEETITSIYGDKWSVEYHKKFHSYCVVIKFDKVTITNSRKQSHEINDLYFLIPLNIEKNKITFNGTLYGGRSSVTLEERDKEYVHSHLSCAWNQIGSFCLGTGPIVSYILDFNRTPNENTLFSVLYNVKIYVEWESLEGTPYREMNTLGKSVINTYESISFDQNKVYEQYIKNHVFPLSISTVNKVIDFHIDRNILEEQLATCVSGINHGKVFKNRTTNIYYRAGKSEYKEQISKEPLLTYKGETIYTKLYNKDITNIQDKNYVAHPYITQRIIEYAIGRIRAYYFKKTSGIDTGKRENYYI